MQAARVVAYGQPVQLVDVAEPAVADPFDVIVRIAGAGVCRTDVHILQGGLAGAFHPTLPYTLGHENAGWVHAVGPAVSHLRTGDPVIVHPAVTCGHCPGCRSGRDMHCNSWRFPGVDGWDGGYAPLLRTNARAVVALPPGTDPTDLAPHADAGLTAIHAVKRLAPFVDSAGTVVVIGAGGVGQLAVQLLRTLTAARVVAVEPDPRRAARAETLGATVVVADVAAVEPGVDAVLDLVGEGAVPDQAVRMLRKGGVYSIVGYGGTVTLELLDLINRELTVQGNQIGTYPDLLELAELVTSGRVRIETQRFPLSAVADALTAVEQGTVLGRAVLVP